MFGGGGGGGGGGHKNLGGGTLTQPRPDEFGMRQRSGKYFAPNPVLTSLVQILRSNLEVKTNKILGYLITFT